MGSPPRYFFGPPRLELLFGQLDALLGGLLHRARGLEPEVGLVGRDDVFPATGVGVTPAEIEVGGGVFRLLGDGSLEVRQSAGLVSRAELAERAVRAQLRRVLLREGAVEHADAVGERADVLQLEADRGEHADVAVRELLGLEEPLARRVGLSPLPEPLPQRERRQRIGRGELQRELHRPRGASLVALGRERDSQVLGERGALGVLLEPRLRERGRFVDLGGVEQQRREVDRAHLVPGDRGEGRAVVLLRGGLVALLHQRPEVGVRVGVVGVSRQGRLEGGAGAGLVTLLEGSLSPRDVGARSARGGRARRPGAPRERRRQGRRTRGLRDLRLGRPAARDI